MTLIYHTYRFAPVIHHVPFYLLITHLLMFHSPNMVWRNTRLAILHTSWKQMLIRVLYGTIVCVLFIVYNLLRMRVIDATDTSVIVPDSLLIL